MKEFLYIQLPTPTKDTPKFERSYWSICCGISSKKEGERLIRILKKCGCDGFELRESHMSEDAEEYMEWEKYCMDFKIPVVTNSHSIYFAGRLFNMRTQRDFAEQYLNDIIKRTVTIKDYWND